MQKINFSDATEISSAFVTVDGINYDVNPAQYNGGTDLNAETFNTMQDNIENSIEEKATYSTEEQVIGTWINGAPIYRKTISILKSELVSESNTISHNISNLESITDVRGSLVREGNIWNDIPWTTKNENWHVIIGDINNTSIGITIGGSTYASLECIYITLEYTKTTD